MIEFLSHLNGILAASLLCALLFVDEVGVPLPFAPNEVLLLLGGLLVGTGVMEPWLFLPLAFAAMLAGMVTGFAWARALGSDRLRDLARPLKAERSYDRAVRRVRAASVPGIALGRLLPGVRVYATLAGGASGIHLRRFLAGAVPALVIWLLALVLVGDVVGRPAEAALGRVDGIVLTGILLVVLGVGAYLVVRHVPRERVEENRLSGVPRWGRNVLALCVDIGIVASVVSGVISVGGRFLQPLSSFDGVVGVSVVVVVGYVAAARRGVGSTLGEGFFAVDLRSLLHVRGRHRGRQPVQHTNPPGEQQLSGVRAATGVSSPAPAGLSHHGAETGGEE